MGSLNYAAAVFTFLLFGTTLILLLRDGLSWSGIAGHRIFGYVFAPPVLPTVREPTVPLLQVFRL